MPASDRRTTERPVCVLHNARHVAALTGVALPDCDAIALPYPLSAEGARTPLASFVDGNPLADDWLLDCEVPGEIIVVWSGSLSSEMFGDDPRTWMRAGHDAFRSFCDSAAPTLTARDRCLAFRPHARHVLSDVQGCLNFLRARADQPFALAFAPSDLLVRTMLPDSEDHLTRAFEALVPRARVALLHDVVPADDTAGDGDLLRPAPLGQGLLPKSVLQRLIRQHLPRTTPIILTPGSLDEQLAFLAEADRA